MEHPVLDAARADGRSASPVAWRNWSGCATARPASILAPRDEAALLDLMRRAQGPLRPAGSGHSFSDLVPTPGTIVALDRLAGPLLRDVDGTRVWLHAGAPLHALAGALQDAGLAFPNLGDINVQTFAGATSTATHGTGRTLPCLSAAISGLRLVTPDEGVIEITRESDPALLQAAQVGLGALGVITAARIDAVPAYRLRRRVWTAPLETVLDEAEALWARHRHFEFLYVPFSGWCVCIAHDLTDEPALPRVYPDDDAAVLGLRRLRDALAHDPATRRAVLAGSLEAEAGEDVTGHGWELLASPRNMLFHEAEAHVPSPSWQDAFRDAVGLIESRHAEVHVPVEVRRTAGDTALLSPFNAGERTSIAVHAGGDDPWRWLVDELWPLMARWGARPHWGKLHGLGRAELEMLYPQFDHFNRIRRQLDRRGRMLNAHLAALFG